MNPENRLGNEIPRTDGTPSRSSENAQFQWLIESVTQLKSSHERMTGTIDHKFECLETKFVARNESLDDKLDTRHKATDDKIMNNHNLIMAKMETLELRIKNSISDSTFSGIKWLVPLLINTPAIIWMVIQVVKAITGKSG